MKPLRLSALLLILSAVAAGSVYAALQLIAPEPATLAAYAPPGALLALESPDFAGLLRSWNNSPEQRRWLGGDDYTAFSRSRLFGRLGDAQNEFAAAAGLKLDNNFLQQIAGSQSLFAWYNIGNLEFLYITRLPPGEAARTPLLALRDKFQQYQAGGVTFYVRSSADAAAAGQPSGGDASSDGSASTNRVAAFAVRGDFLLLATREDLLAMALEQMGHPGGRSLATDTWYAATVAAAKERPGDLRLTLDLTTITRSPYFRSYWVQQNISDMRRYTASLSDLYRDASSFREERFLLPSSSSRSYGDADLSPVLRFLPRGVVYRTVAHPSAADALGELEDKLLARTAVSLHLPGEAPSAQLTVPIAGDPSDLDDRIDTPSAPTGDRAATVTELASLLDSHAPVSMLSFSTAAALDTPTANATPKRNDIFRPIHTGVVFSVGTVCDAAAWQKALTATLSPRVSVGNVGLQWHEQTNGAATWFQLDGPFSLAFARHGDTCLLASDSATLLAMLSAGNAAATHQAPAGTIAGFSHTAQQRPLLKLASLLDHGGSQPSNAGDFGSGNQPPFFSGNMASLSTTFGDLDSETFTEFQASPTLTRQTVTYLWRHR